MDTIRIRRGDTSPLYYTIKDLEPESNDYPPRDLTNCIITFSMYAPEQNAGEEGRVILASSNSITMSYTASSYDNAYIGLYVNIFDGTGIGQTRTIIAYNGTTKVATLSEAWTIIPDTSSRYKLQISEGGYIIDSASCTNLTDTTEGLTSFEFSTINPETNTAGMYKAWWTVTDENGTSKKYPYETQWIHIYSDN